MAVTFHERELANGLRVIAEVDPGAHSAAAGFFVKTGARDEDPALMGVSHFLEHMMFKGTEDLSADALNQAFDNMGARNNAYTSGEMTCFYAQVVPERLGEGVRLLGRMMRPALREDDFQTEKGVILEEIAMYRDNPFMVLYEETIERHYRGSRLGHRVLGTLETIRAMTSEGMRGYFGARYSPDNTVVSLAGRVDFEAAVGEVERVCDAWERTGATREAGPERGVGGRFEMTDAGLSRAYLLGVGDGPGAQDGRRYAAAMAAQVFGGGGNSRLHWALVEPGIAEEAAAGFEPGDGTGMFYAFASCEPARAEEVWGVVRSESERLAGSLTEDDLAKLRTKMATGVTLHGERPGDRMQRLGRLWTLLGEYVTLEEELERINGVTVEDVRGVLASFSIGGDTVGRLGP